MDRTNIESREHAVGDHASPATGPGTTDHTPEEILAELEANEQAEHFAVLTELEQEYMRLGEPKVGKLVRLDLVSVERDPALRMRARLDEAAIEDYDSKYIREKKGLKGLQKNERLFPLVEVFEITPGKYTVVNGWHRIEGMQRADIKTWLFSVQTGDIRAAAKYAASANRTNVSVRVTNADKRQMVKALWAVFPNATAHRIGDMAGVDHHTAQRHRPHGGTDQPREGKGGRKYNPKPSKAGTGKKERQAATNSTANSSSTTSTGRSLAADRAAGDDGSSILTTGEIPQEVAALTPANDVPLVADKALSIPSRSPSAPAPPREMPVRETSLSVSVGADTEWQRVDIDGYRLSVRVLAVDGGVATLRFLDGGPVVSVSNG